MLSACLAEGTTTISNAAREPEIIDLQNFLNKMGAKIKGAGTNIIEIVGVKQLKDVDYNVMSDRIEAGTFLVAGAITGGNIKINNISSTCIEPVINKLEDMLLIFMFPPVIAPATKNVPASILSDITL